MSEEKGTIRAVFFTQSGGDLLTKIAARPINQTYIEMIRDYLLGLSQETSVVWFGPQAELVEDIRSINPLRGKYVPNFKQGISYLDDFLEQYSVQYGSNNLKYLSILKGTQFKPSDFYSDGAFTYSDSDHWSSHGEKIFGARLLKHEMIAGYLSKPALSD